MGEPSFVEGGLLFYHKVERPVWTRMRPFGFDIKNGCGAGIKKPAEVFRIPAEGEELA